MKFILLTLLLCFVSCTVAPKTQIMSLDLATMRSAYEVYQGCAQPPASYTKTLYVDPVKGVRTNDGLTPNTAIHSVTEGVVDLKVVGDTKVIMMPGLHSGLNLNEYTAKLLIGSSGWIKLEFQPGAKMTTLTIGSKLGKFLITGGKFFGTVTLSGSDIVFTNNQIIGSKKDKLKLTAAEWLKVPDGASLSDGPCISMTHNKLRNVRTAITVSGSGIEASYPANGVKALIKANDVDGLSADGLRGLGSDISFINNRIVDGFVGDEDGDGNHDDMFQGFALDGAVYQNLVIEGNTMIDSLIDHPLRSAYQGISIFDGLYKNVVVRKNVVVGGEYHGIAMCGVDGLLIENNTVVSDYKPGGRNFWIAAFESKTGVLPKNNVIRNNLSDRFLTPELSTNSNNFTISDPHADYVDYDFLAGKLDVHLKTTSAAFGKGAGAF